MPTRLLLGSELRHTAFGFCSGAFSLAGIHVEEIGRTGLQVANVNSMRLANGLFVVGIWRFGHLR